MAGEWPAVREFLAKLPPATAEPIYAAILQSLNRGDQGLLPEEVLALADASPGDLKPWQEAALSKILRQAAARNGTGTLMETLRAGEGRFGSRDAESRRVRHAGVVTGTAFVAIEVARPRRFGRGTCDEHGAQSGERE